MEVPKDVVTWETTLRDTAYLNGNTTDIKTIHFPREATIFASACAITFIIVGLFGNLLTITALSRCHKLRLQATTAFVISLCVSDLIFCLFNLPLTAARYIQEEWTLGATLCRLFPFFFYGNVAASLMSMVAITLNRYVLIAYHHLYERIYSKQNLVGMIMLLWTFSFSILVPPLFEIWGKLGLDPPTFSCTILKKDGRSPKKFLFVFGFILPCVAIVVCYGCIFYKVQQSRKNLQAHCPCNGTSTAMTSASNQREDIRITRMMLLIFCCFLLCFLPLMLVNVADDHITYPSIHILASILAWASSVINPLIYAVSNHQYRQAYRKLFCGLTSNGKSNGGASNNSNSRSGSGKTFFTEMIQFQSGSDKVIVMSNKDIPVS